MAEFRMLPERDAEGTTKRVYEEILKVKHLRKHLISFKPWQTALPCYRERGVFIGT